MPGNCYNLSTNDLAEDENAISLFPNPATDYAFVNLENTALTNTTTIIISDVLGRELQRIPLNQIASNGMMISLTDLSGGTYFCRFIDGGKDLVKPVKLVVQK